MIRIATVNIGGCGEDQRQRLAGLVDDLKAEEIDILCCQEMFFSDDGHHNAAIFLAGKLGMTCSYSATRQNEITCGERTTDTATGVAILTGSDAWMLASGSFPRPGGEGGQGAAQFAVVRKNGNAVLVINLHLALSRLEERWLVRLLRTMSSHPVLQQPYAAVLFCGDLDSCRTAQALAILTEDTGLRVLDLYPAGKEALAGRKKRVQQTISILEQGSQPLARLTTSNRRPLTFRTATGSRKVTTTGNGLLLDLALSRIRERKAGQGRGRFSAVLPQWTTGWGDTACRGI